MLVTIADQDSEARIIQLLKDTLHPIPEFRYIEEVVAQLRVHTTGQTVTLGTVLYPTYLSLVEQAATKYDAACSTTTHAPFRRRSHSINSAGVVIVPADYVEEANLAQYDFHTMSISEFEVLSAQLDAT